jgi:hypothetical protein
LARRSLHVADGETSGYGDAKTCERNGIIGVLVSELADVRIVQLLRNIWRVSENN